MDLVKKNPAVDYLARLGKGSRRSQSAALETIVDIMGGGLVGASRFPWHDLTPAVIGVLRGELERRYAPATANRHLYALRGVLRSAWRQGLLSEDEYARLADFRPVPGNSVRKGRMLSMDDIAAVMGAALGQKKKKQAVRDAAIVAVAFEAGLRRMELVNLDVEDYINGTLHIVKGKGNKTREVPLSGARGHLERWLVLRGKEPGPLFVPIPYGRIERKRLNQNTIAFLFERLSKRAGVERFSPHDARRTFISTLLATGSDLAVAARLAGHSRPQTTAMYDRRPVEASASAVRAMEMPL